MTHDKRLLFGERLHNRRNALKFTQEYVADSVGISLRFYQMLERGEKSVSLDTLIRLSEVLTISTDYLIFGDLPHTHTLENPIVEVFNGLNQHQREDALKILQLYAKACEGQSG